tara:strand:- start:6131 stop:6988 length:858 start_codon:yes stop_codon:yes gene_type:complete
MSNWLASKVNRLFSGQRKEVPAGVWSQCLKCGTALYRPELERNYMVCTKCNNHLRIGARARLNYFLDSTGREELAEEVKPSDLLGFKDSKKYKDRLSAAQKKTGENSALLVMRGTVKQLPVIVAAFEFGFIGGSMGAAVGERFVQGVHAAIAQKVPFICFTSSGGARMQEGLFSLMQMSKTSAALARLAKAKLPYIVVLTDPTTGGVSASLAMLGDVIIAEPDALIGFAGPRVIKQTVQEDLPEGFQRSEFLLAHGAIDMIVPRSALSERVHSILSMMMHAQIAQ